MVIRNTKLRMAGFSVGSWEPGTTGWMRNA
jgi:hypothetical protein